MIYYFLKNGLTKTTHNIAFGNMVAEGSPMNI